MNARACAWLVRGLGRVHVRSSSKCGSLARSGKRTLHAMGFPRNGHTLELIHVGESDDTTR